MEVCVKSFGLLTVCVQMFTCVCLNDYSHTKSPSCYTLLSDLQAASGG